MTSRDAAHTTSRARRLRDLPVVASSWQAGELSGGQVDAIVASLRPATQALFAHHEAAVVPSLVGLSVTDTAKAMHAWAAHAEAISDEGEPAEPERALHLCSAPATTTASTSPGWHPKLRPDATFELTDPSGRHWSTAPPRAGPPLDGYASTSSTARQMAGKA